jgi:SpoVK/Ycf46/Vps4 family AAA+-type ATPase
MTDSNFYKKEWHPQFSTYYCSGSGKNHREEKVCQKKGVAPPTYYCKGIYENGRQHLDDELLKLDALLELQVLKHRQQSANTSDEKGQDLFRGLCITEEDVNRVIKERPGSETAPKRKTLADQVKNHRERLVAKIENSLKKGVYLPICHLASMFQLGSFEWDTIIICLAPEVDLKYETLYAYLQDDVTKKQPSVNLILDLSGLNGEERLDERESFLEHSPLLKYGLVTFIDDGNGTDGEAGSSKPLLSRCLKLDDRIADFLLGFEGMDSRLFSFAHLVHPRTEWESLVMEDSLKQRLMRLADNCLQDSGRSMQRYVFYLQGPYGAGKKAAAAAFCRHLQVPLILVDTRDLLLLWNRDSAADFVKVVRRLFRETLLQPAAIYFEGFDRLAADSGKGARGDSDLLSACRKRIIEAVQEFAFITFFAGETDWHSRGGIEGQKFINILFPVPSFPLRKQLWKQSLNGRFTLNPGIDIDAIANTFQFTAGQIRDAVEEAANRAVLREEKNDSGSPGAIHTEDLYRGCHSQSNQKLSEMAQKVKPKYSWTDIMLPMDKLQQLQDICNHVKYRQMVYREWGFGAKLSLGKGLNVLFSGPSGTGKTMSAEIIAGRLGLVLYKIDLSNVVSKYIGETEKNLNRIFKEAETANCILFFDEADALFGKRSEVKDSHDRYANIEIGYLLQKMEEHEGVVILATNFLKNIDEAFKRRIHFSIYFPFPDEGYRLKIWQNIFPPQMPGSKDIDFEFLAKKFKLSGGNIKNIAVNAAFLAAGDSPQMGMSHALLAAKRELQKMGKHCSPSDFGKYYDLISSRAGDENE